MTLAAATTAPVDATWVAEHTAAAEAMSTAELLAWAAGQWGAGAAIAASFGVEDVVLLHLAAAHAPAIGAFTLDTGRLPPETYDVIEALRERLGLSLVTYLPDHAAVERLVATEGFFSFRTDRAARLRCCDVRKREPLARALAGRTAWLTGLRRQQGVTRVDAPVLAWDGEHGLAKLNPLAAWTRDQIWDHVRDHRLPYNRLHDHGYPSIGCAPCTRAVRPYEDERAGRWWWESDEHRECGLHTRRP